MPLFPHMQKWFSNDASHMVMDQMMSIAENPDPSVDIWAISSSDKPVKIIIFCILSKKMQQ